MKKISRVYKWIIISIIIQLIILVFFNNFYLNRTNEFVAASVDLSGTPKADKDIKIPNDATLIKGIF